MAHQFLPVYNVDAPVGMGQTNSLDDVRLVQKLFLALRGPLAYRFATLPAISANGIFTPGLEGRIRTFQATSQEMAQDGKINPIPVQDGHFVTRIGRLHPTLLMLNYNVLMNDGPAFRRIAEDMRLVIRTRLP